MRARVDLLLGLSLALKCKQRLDIYESIVVTVYPYINHNLGESTQILTVPGCQPVRAQRVLEERTSARNDHLL